MIEGLKEKVVIVTGGGHGIGRAYCHGFAEAGAKVVVADIDAPAAEKVAGEVIQQFDGKALAAKIDVANETSTQDMAKLPSINSAVSTFWSTTRRSSRPFR